MRAVRIDDVRIAYQSAGAGEPVLLLHGYPEDHRSWRKQVSELSTSYRVVVPDLPGWGRSTRDPAIAYDYASQLRRLTRFIESLDLPPLNLVAHDYGALLALGYAVERPWKLKRLAILNSRAHGEFACAYRFILRSQCRVAASSAGAHLFERLPWYWIHRGLLARYRRNGSMDRKTSEAYLAWMREPSGKRFLRRFYADYPVAPIPRLADGLSRVTCPTAVIWGERDPYCPTAIGRDLASRLPDAQFESLPHADHFVHEQCPAAVNSSLETLLRRQSESEHAHGRTGAIPLTRGRTP